MESQTERDLSGRSPADLLALLHSSADLSLFRMKSPTVLSQRLFPPTSAVKRKSKDSQEQAKTRRQE